MDWSVDNEICHHRAQHGQNMTTDTKTEVVASSATDLVCYISSLSSDARYSHQEVDKDLIPGKLSLLDTQWAKSKWKFAIGALTKCLLKQKQLVSILSCSKSMSSHPTPLLTVSWITTKNCV